MSADLALFIITAALFGILFSPGPRSPITAAVFSAIMLSFSGFRHGLIILEQASRFIGRNDDWSFIKNG